MEPKNDSNILKHDIDRYQAATFVLESLPTDPENFDKMLSETLQYFTKVKVRGVWLKLDLTRSTLISVALKHGFRYHHVKKDYVLLSYWVPKDEPNKLPHYVTHTIGVGGVVINEETDEILLVQERSGRLKDVWNIPGGQLDNNEYISQTAEREVFEETGIKAEFQYLICFRDAINFRWGASDLYFVCFLKPITFDIKHDTGEIKNAKWMKIDKYLELQSMSETQKKIAQVVALRKVKRMDIIKKSNPDTLDEIIGFFGDQYKSSLGILYYRYFDEFIHRRSNFRFLWTWNS